MTTTAPAGRRWTLRRRLLGLLVTAGVVLGLVLAAAGLVFAHVVELQERVTVTYFDAVTDADRAYVRLVDAETGVRGYALTGDRAALEPYEGVATSGEGFAALAELARRTGGDDPLVVLAQEAAAASERWDVEWAQPLIAQIRADGPDSVTAEQVEAGRALFDEARDAVDAYLAELRVQRTDSLDALQRWTRVASVFVAGLVLAAVGIGAALWIQLRRWIVEPLDALAADARAVGSGDLDHEVRASGPEEIADLGRDVESMRRALVATVVEVERSRAEIAEAHARLVEQAEELRRSNRDLEQFAYVASHDLQEPLRKVASFTQLLQKRYGGQLDERADQYIEFAVDGAKRMQRLIQDLLGFSRVGRIGGELTDVDLEEVLGQALGDLEQAVEESGAVVTHDPLPTVRGEQPLLEQLLQNLVGNALKFRHTDRAPRIHIGVREVPGAWELECRDNGIGIDQQYADRVFVIFQRLHPKDVYEGTGIGLALCKKIVEYHGGRIWIDDDGREGTSVRWTLPRDDDA